MVSWFNHNPFDHRMALVDTGMDGSGIMNHGSWAFEDDILIYRSVRFRGNQDTSDEGSEEEIYTISSSSSEGYYSD